MKKKILYYDILNKLCKNDYIQTELNRFIEDIFIIAAGYTRYHFRKIEQALHFLGISNDDFVVDAIEPLFRKDENGRFKALVEQFEKWQPPVTSEKDANFFLNKIIAGRVEQHVSVLLRESDPLYAKLLDSINYLIRTGKYKKVICLGITYIVKEDIQEVELPVITTEEFSGISSDLFSDNKTIFDCLFNFLSSDEKYFPAIPLNGLIIRLKQLRVDAFYTSDSIAAEYKNLEISEAIEISLQFIKSKLVLSYLEKGKLCEEECQSLIAGLKDMVNDLRDGGINPGLYEYLKPHFNSLSKQVYLEKYHNIFEYMAKTLKSKLVSEMV